MNISKKKNGKKPGDIIIFQNCTKNNDYRLHCSQDMEHDGCNYFSFSAIFCPFTSITARKIKISIKTNNFLHTSFYTCTRNDDHMLYCSSDMTCDTCNFYFSFWAIFCPFTPLTAWKMKISKKWKKHLEISSFYTRVPKVMIRWCTVPERCGAGWTDRQTDRQKKWHIEVGAPSNKYVNIERILQAYF